MSRNENHIVIKEKINSRLQRIANVLLLNASFIDNCRFLDIKVKILIVFLLSIFIKLKEKGGKLLCALCSELCANTLRPNLSLTERGCYYAKIIFFRYYDCGL